MLSNNCSMRTKLKNLVRHTQQVEAKHPDVDRDFFVKAMLFKDGLTLSSDDNKTNFFKMLIKMIKERPLVKNRVLRRLSKAARKQGKLVNIFDVIEAVKQKQDLRTVNFVTPKKPLTYEE